MKWKLERNDKKDVAMRCKDMEESKMIIRFPMKFDIEFVWFHVLPTLTNLLIGTIYLDSILDFLVKKFQAQEEKKYCPF